MLRTFVLIAINVTVALVMAASILPVAIVMAPIVRESPGAGLGIFGAATALFTGMNIVLWKQWKRR